MDKKEMTAEETIEAVEDKIAYIVHNSQEKATGYLEAATERCLTDSEVMDIEKMKGELDSILEYIGNRVEERPREELKFSTTEEMSTKDLTLYCMSIELIFYKLVTLSLMHKIDERRNLMKRRKENPRTDLH